MSYLILVILWVLFYFLHSFLASLNIKRKIKGMMGRQYIWYRLMYSVFALIHLLAILIYAAGIKQSFLFDKSHLVTYFGYMAAAFGTIVLVRSMKYLSGKKFLGLSAHDDLTDQGTLVTKGIHSYIRHPIYAGLILIFFGYFLYQPYPTSLVHLVMLLVYLPFGIHLEEKKLISAFGQEYLDYQKEVPSLIPYKRKRTV
ncbi:isoprenylcysteine carboxylmethyltransferase family protein [Aquiflexum sp.]|uniref:methyltransferase family protein n=1 Tax=Aquiflexum sp. TaxID=1872584 RepID=UPI0035937F6E